MRGRRVVSALLVLVSSVALMAPQVVSESEPLSGVAIEKPVWTLMVGESVSDLAALKAASTNVAIVDVVQAVAVVGQGRYLATVFHIAVAENIIGVAPPNFVTRQWGGESATDIARAWGDPQLRAGDQLVLFFRAEPVDESFPNRGLPFYAMVGGAGGRFHVQQGLVSSLDHVEAGVTHVTYSVHDMPLATFVEEVRTA